MNQYLKILVSMIGTLLIFSLLVAFLDFVFSWPTVILKNNIVESLFTFPMLILFGALFYFVPFASILWLIIYKQLSKSIEEERKLHLFSVILSSILLPLIVNILEVHYVESIKSGYFIIFIFVLPVAILNYFVYQKLFIK